MKVNSVIIIERAELRKRLAELQSDYKRLLEVLADRKPNEDKSIEYTERYSTLYKRHCQLEGVINFIKELLKE